MRAYLIEIILAAFCVATPVWACAQGASDNAEARVYFQEGNRLVREANEAPAGQREALLQRALESYVDSLQIVRSRNALFNAAVTLEELHRYEESFNYYTEYLRIAGLSESDRKEAEARRDALRSSIAVLELGTDPQGAEVWLDRRDLAPLGVTPIELAIRPGPHRAYVSKDGYLSASQPLTATTGERTVLALGLEPAAVEPAAPVETPVPAPAPVEARPRLRNAAIGTAASTLAVAAVGLGVSLKARSLHDDYNRAADAYEMSGDPDDLARANELADRTDRFNIAADVMWGTTIALGVSAIVLYVKHRKHQRRERAQVDVSITRHGGFAALRMPIGGSP